MKLKFVICLLAASLTLCCAGCGGNQPGSDGPNGEDPADRLLSVEEVEASLGIGGDVCAAYDAEKYMLPIWESQVVYNETVCFIKNQDGTFPIEQLTYPIAKVLEVRDSSLKMVYEQGKDYEIIDGGIRLLADTNICHFAFDEFYLKAAPSSTSVVKSNKYPDRYLKLGDGSYFYTHQVCVSYIRTQAYNGPSVRDDGERIPLTIEKLKQKESVKIVWYGDSITTGSSVSGWQFANVAPYTPIFSDQVTERLQNFYGYRDIHSVNTAVGGWTAGGAKSPEEVTDKVLQYSPDLVVLAFGMNDGGGAINAGFRQTFQTDIETIISYVRRFLPDCEFLLVSTMLPNPDSEGNPANHKDCLKALLNLVDEYEGIALADMTSMSDWLLQRKDFQDMGDNLVHPTDFLSRIYAQVLLNTLIN